MFSQIQSIGSSIWGTLPRIGPLFDDSEDIFPIDQLPNELLCHIFGFLPPKALACASQVTERWQALASDKEVQNAIDLKQIRGVTVIDQAFVEEWIDTAAFDLNFDDLPEVRNCDLIPILKILLARGVVEDDAGVTVLTMPGGLDWDKLDAMAKDPKKGHKTLFFELSGEISRGLREIPASKACIVLISNTILSGSRDLSYSPSIMAGVHKLVDVHKRMVRDIGCGMPEALPLGMLAALKRISTGAQLYANVKPETYTCCLETTRINTYDGKVLIRELVLGSGPYPNGFEVTSTFLSNMHGVGAMWKFPAIGT